MQPSAHHSPFLTALTAAIGLVSLTACPGSLSEPERFDEAESTIVVDTAELEGCGYVEDTFVRSCTTSGCHSGQGISATVDFQSPGLFARLASQRATGGNGMLIVPGNPDASIVMQKLGANPPFGGRMPIGTPLDDATLSCIRKWIEVNR